jgi:hypothetical protein
MVLENIFLKRGCKKSVKAPSKNVFFGGLKIRIAIFGDELIFYKCVIKKKQNSGMVLVDYVIKNYKTYFKSFNYASIAA